MLYCPNCRQQIRWPQITGPELPLHGMQMIVKSDWELKLRRTRQVIAIATARLGKSRRGELDWLGGTIFGYVEFGGALLWPDGREFEVDDELIDRAFKDADGRWLSDLKKSAGDLPKNRSSVRVLDKLRLLDIAHRIAHRLGGPDFPGHPPAINGQPG